MAIIKISELRPAGSELFQDSESFLNELTEREVGGIEGARTIGTIGSVSIGAFTVVGNTVNANTLGGNLNTVAVGQLHPKTTLIIYFNYNTNSSYQNFLT